MPNAFENFLYSYCKKGKPIFVPNDFSKSLGKKLVREVTKKYTFDKFIYHFKEGSHVLALHRHRENTFFCRVDIHRFFYSVKRNRLKRILKAVGIPKPEYYAKWSTVKNPFEGGGYVLPYGFVQSPMLATLILAESPIGTFIRDLPETIDASVYMDDLCLSGNDELELREAFAKLKEAVAGAGFNLNKEKTREPAKQIDIFNCSLEHGTTAVLPQRIDEFYLEERSGAAAASFETYCDIIKSHKWRVGDGKRRRRKAYKSKKKAAVQTAL